MSEPAQDLCQFKRLCPLLAIPVDIGRQLNEQRHRQIPPALLCPPTHGQHVQLVERQAPELGLTQAKLDTRKAPVAFPGDALGKGPSGSC